MTAPIPMSPSPRPAPQGPRREVRGSDSIRAYMDQVRRVPLLTREQEVELAIRHRDCGDPGAARRLVDANLRFVVRVALGYRRYGVPLPDLIQEGNLGLIQAVERFDPTRGIRLISYAVWWIRAYIQSAVLRSWSVVRVGTTHTQRRLFYRLPSEAAAAVAGGGTAGGAEELAERLGVPPREVRDMQRRLAGRDVSLDAPVDDDRGFSPMDRLADGGQDPETEAADAQDRAARRDRLRDALGCLPARERAIVEQRHLAEEPRTLAQLGEDLGLSRERVRQLECAALVKLRRALVADAA